MLVIDNLKIINPKNLMNRNLLTARVDNPVDKQHETTVTKQQRKDESARPESIHVRRDIGLLLRLLDRSLLRSDDLLLLQLNDSTVFVLGPG